jgi:dephospho-CoA kinase
MREEDVRARMANQVSRQDRLAKADHVIDNSGTVEDLAARVADLWPRLAAAGSGG